MNFNFANLAMLSYLPQGKASLHAHQQGGASFMSLLMLENLNAFLETFDPWQLAMDAQGDALNQASEQTDPRQTSDSKIGVTPKAKASKTPKPSYQEGACVQTAPVLRPKTTFENTLKAVQSLQELHPTQAVESPEVKTLNVSTSLNSLRMDQHPWLQQWFQQWIQQWAPTVDPQGKKGTQKSNGLEAGHPLFNSFSNPFAPESLSETGSGKAPTPAERMAFLKFLQIQMEEAHKKGKPFRVDVDADTSVVLSLKPDGVSATFLINDASTEKIKQVQQQLNALQASLHARKLPVKTLHVEGASAVVKDPPLIEAIEARPEHETPKKPKQQATSKKASK